MTGKEGKVEKNMSKFVGNKIPYLFFDIQF